MSQSALDTQLTFGQVYDEDAEEMEIPDELKQQLFGSEGSASQLHRVRRPPRVVALTNDATQSALTDDATQSESALEDLPGELDILESGEGVEGQQPTQSSGMAKDWLLEQLRQAQVDQNRQQGAGLEEEQRMEARLQKWLKRERVKLWTHIPESPTDLDFGTEGLAVALPQTIPYMLKAAAKRCPSAAALTWHNPSSGDSAQLTYEQYWWKVVNIARSFIRHGIFRFARVCIVGRSCVNWHCTALGAILAGGVIMGISPESSEEDILKVFTTCKVSICVVENLGQFDKVYEVWPQLPHLNAVVLWDGHLTYPLNRVYEWDNFLAKGLAVGLDAITEEMQKQEVVHCTVLSCTAGSTGPPKRAMLTHDNIVWTAKSLKATFGDTVLQDGKERFVSYSPPLHIANMVVDVFLPILVGGCVCVAPPPEEGLVKVLREAQPTVFFGKPRVWQQVMLEAAAVGGAGGGKSKQKSKKGNKGLGLESCRLSLVGGAPVPNGLLAFFASHKVQLKEVYGCTETTGFAFANKLEGEQMEGSQGLSMVGVQTSIGMPDTTGNGEVLVRGRNVFSGFYGDEEATEEAIDEDGWLHTGDVGRRDERGFLHLYAQKGEVLITTPGEYVLPEPIEAALLEYIPFLGHAFVIGHGRKYLTCLFTIKGEMNAETGEPTDNIHEDVTDMVAQVSAKQYTTTSELLDAEDEGISQAIVDGITKYNQERAASYNQKILKFHLLETDFSTHGGELDDANRPQRGAILDKYAEEIEQLYAE